MPTVLSLPFWLPVAWSSMTDCAPCPRVSAPFTACSAARRSLSVSWPASGCSRCCREHHPPRRRAQGSGRKILLHGVGLCAALRGGGDADVFPGERHVLPAIRSEPWTLRSLPALSVTLPFTEPIVLPRWVVSCAVSVTFRLWLP
jgi:hypothetical protein